MIIVPRTPSGRRSSHEHRDATAMASLVGSLADNKAALGRRYAEWAVSAPTLESAVAAAAMAQDELGHARSTYPVLKALGVDAGDEGFGGDRRLALLDDELPDWNAFIAANLLVDGVLTTFVAAVRGLAASSRWPSARRRSSRRRARTASHGEAWAQAPVPRRPQRDAFVARLLETWEHAGALDRARRRPGLRGRARGRRGRADRRPPARADARLARPACSPREGVAIALPEPTDWSAWDPERRRWTP